MSGYSDLRIDPSAGIMVSAGVVPGIRNPTVDKTGTVEALWMGGGNELICYH